jgi:hypothetical protein
MNIGFPKCMSSEYTELSPDGPEVVVAVAQVSMMQDVERIVPRSLRRSASDTKGCSTRSQVPKLEDIK